MKHGENIKTSGGQSLEQIASYEGNESQVLVERLCHPAILEKLVNTFYAGYMARAESRKTVQRPEQDASGEEVRDTDGAYILHEYPYVPPTKDEIRKEILARIEDVRTVTPISFGSEIPTNECIPLNWKIPGDIIPTDKQKSIIEAHEKGHHVRFFPGGLEGDNYYRDMFGKAFDFRNIVYTDQEYRDSKLSLETSLGRETFFEEARDILIQYMSDPMELTERMSQIKNYFGMKGDETFTIEHLQYARKQYIKDTDMDNHMSQFFDGIINDTEFVQLMNTVGV
jgi:hypothetical protein